MQRIFKYGNTQNISLTPNKELNTFLMYGFYWATLWYEVMNCFSPFSYVVCYC